MKCRIREGYVFFKRNSTTEGNAIHAGEVVEVSQEEYEAQSWKLEAIKASKVVEKEPEVEETPVEVEEEPEEKGFTAIKNRMVKRGKNK